MKRTIIKIMRIDIEEFEKCKTGKEFKANFITYPGPKPPPGMPKWFKEWSEEVYEKNQHKIETTLAEHGKAIANLDNKLTNVIRLNNLKTK